MRLLTYIFILLPFLYFAQAPTANFTASPLSVCLGSPINFTSTSTANGSPIVSYAWDFGDGNSATTANTSHIYSTPGTYTVILTVTAQNGMADPEVKVNYVTVNPLPNASFTTSGVGCTVPFNVTFTNTSSSGSNFTYNWNFGNGQTSTQQNPAAVTYSTAGTFPVSLTVTNTTTGCTNNFTQNVVISDYAANMNAPISACVGATVSFTDASTVGANSWNWNFGDGQTSTAQNPTHTYATAGNYTVSLTSQNTISGCSDNVTQNITINPLPTPTFTATNTIGCAPLQVSFTNTSGPGTTFQWDFGNGTTFTGQNPPSQTYSADGSYTVTLTMTNANGCNNTITQTNLVNVSAPTVQFSMDQYNGCAILPVTFTESSTSPNPSGDPIVTWLWNFGDGSPIVSGQNPPVHNYDVGVYDVTLTVITQNGCQATLTLPDTIQVGSVQNVDFSISPIIECAKTPIDFTDLTTYNGNPDPNDITYEWDFGDGGSSTQQNPSYSYPSDTGFFDVSLIVEWRGCRDTLIVTDAVYIKAPISLFTPDQTLFCNPASLPITLNVTDNSIIGQIPDDVEMVWKWGDGTFTNFDDPDVDDADQGSTSHNYNAYGSYTIEQVIYNHTTGCSDSTTQTIHVSTTTAGFTLSNDSTCVGSPIVLTSTSTSSHPFGTFSYNMGNGNTVTGNPAIFTYNSFGSFDILQTATNVVGCANTSTFIGLDALALPSAGATPSATAGCAPITVTYTNTSNVNNNGVPLSSFLWTFPNSSTQTTNNVGTNTQFTFTTEGNFNTTLVVTDEFGCVSAPATIPMSITKPTANFTLDSVVCDLESFTAVNGSSGATSYQWSVDGTNTSTNTDYTSSFDEVTSQGSNSVSHTVTLIATDANGCMDTISDVIIVSMPYLDIDYTLSGANVNGQGEFTCPPVFATFTDGSNTYGDIVTWAWNFGDGKFSSLENPNNTYVFAGTYSASLSITDEFGCTADTTLIDYLTIFGPSGTPSWTSGADVCGQLFQFEATDLVSVSDIIWDLDDGTTENSVNPFTHQYESYTTYNPTATLVDSLGCEVIYELDPIVVVSNGLNAHFTPTPVKGPVGTIFNFIENSTVTGAPINTWIWIVDGDTSTYFSSTDISTTLGLPGDYEITLIVIDQNGCSDSYTFVVTVTDEFHLPNVITSNNDGVNDFFVLPVEIFKSFDIVILNRWGNVIHLENGATGILLWNGLTDKGAKVEDGVYFYKLVGTLPKGEVVEKHGNVTVVNGL